MTWKLETETKQLGAGWMTEAYAVRQGQNYARMLVKTVTRSTKEEGEAYATRVGAAIVNRMNKPRHVDSEDL